MMKSFQGQVAIAQFHNNPDSYCIVPGPKSIKYTLQVRLKQIVDKCLKNFMKLY